MSSVKHILVVANQTVAGDAVIAAIQRRLGDEPVRVKVVCPLSGGDGWVVDDEEARAATRARLEQLLSALHEAGLEAEGEVVASDPYDAVMDRVESGDPPAEIIISTLPRTRSGWLRRDLVDRVRDRTEVPVEHIVANPVEPAQS